MVHPDPSLWHCLGRFDWDAAQLRIASHPEEVQEVFDGKTTLIVACMSIVRRRQGTCAFSVPVCVSYRLQKQVTNNPPYKFKSFHSSPSNRVVSRND